MGSMICQLLRTNPDVKRIYDVDVKQATYTSLNEVPASDVLIDFSHPNLIEDIISYGLKHHTPLVIATTGHTDNQQKLIQQAALELPVFMSANYSFGIEVMTHILRQISQILVPEFDVEIIEKHHHHKIDAPSGTSKHLANTILICICATCGIQWTSRKTKRDRFSHSCHQRRIDCW
jgi:4-hydroxy-tetrahydrodipicolinate reductase